MAEYRPKGQGLERVLGTGALFSTAYGNVGSSIYYALGLVAVFALGMTPVVFVIAGLIFAATAATYAEATTMYPEAGGSSSFARRAFNEFWSFFAAWGQMLTYIITISISAFFVPHYLGRLLGAAGRVAGRHRRRHRRRGPARDPERRRRQGVGRREHLPRGRRLLTQVLLVIVGFVLVLARRLLVRQRRLRHHADGRRLPDRDPGRRWSPTPASRRSRTWPRRRATPARRSRAGSAWWWSPWP